MEKGECNSNPDTDPVIKIQDSSLEVTTTKGDSENGDDERITW